MALYRAADSQGNTPSVSLERDAGCRGGQTLRTSKRCTPRGVPLPGARPVEEQVEEPIALADPNTATSAPRVINVDKNAAYPRAIADLKAAGILPEGVELRQVKYLNNLLEQDHRF